jgi:tRNA threonylcarbamoyl adenosine modification protein YeaZ
MILLINTSSNEELTVALATREGIIVSSKKVKRRFQQSEKLLTVIETLAKNSKCRLRQLTGVAVVAGPGGFTSLRTGIATANALAYGLHLPVVGLMTNQFNSLASFGRAAAVRIKNRQVGLLVAPSYGQEPNITKAKNIPFTPYLT